MSHANDHLYALYLDAYARSRSPTDTRMDTMPCDYSAADRLAVAIGVRDAQSRTSLFTRDEFLSAHEMAMTPDDRGISRRSLAAIVHDALRELKIENPSTALVRAALMHEHAKAARDLAHSFAGMLEVSDSGLIALDNAEATTAKSYHGLLSLERAGVPSTEPGK